MLQSRTALTEKLRDTFMLPAMLTRRLPHRWRTRIEGDRHNHAIKEILTTPPIVPIDDGLVLFSMIGTAVLLPYLVAVKSLWHQLRRGRVVILDDGSLTVHDKAVLALHCGDPEIISISTVVTNGFPNGGCWERLLTILDRRHGEFWVQLDSDTVTLGPIPEVAQAIASNRSFTMLGGSEGEVGALPLATFTRSLYPEGAEDNHIQARIESRMDLMPQDKGWHYIRGCAGFAGFAAGGQDGRSLAAAFLGEIIKLTGQNDAAIWGTEQIASNFVIANETAPMLLPSARYINYWGVPWTDDTIFLHFVGTHRHDHKAYIQASLNVIETLKTLSTRAVT